MGSAVCGTKCSVGGALRRISCRCVKEYPITSALFLPDLFCTNKPSGVPSGQGVDFVDMRLELARRTHLARDGHITVTMSSRAIVPGPNEKLD